MIQRTGHHVGMKSSGQRRGLETVHGFTLVELLVVIGIIALLISILLPALSSARRQAMQVKCASNLRECGQALALYASAYRGYGVPVRCGGGIPSGNPSPNTGEVSQTSGQGRYDLNGVIYGVSSQPAGTTGAWTSDSPYWENFLAPYVSTLKGGQADQANNITTGAMTTAQALAQAKLQVFACPSWNPSDAMTKNHPNITGYAMNYQVTREPYYPALSSGTSTETTSCYVPWNEWFNVVLNANGTVNTTDGTWYQLSSIKNPDLRCFLADGNYNQLVCWGTPNTSSGPINKSAGIPIPPPQAVMPTGGTTPYSSGNATTPNGQNAFDCYRHGVYPNVINSWSGNGMSITGACYSPSGGKIAYNILYFDGHVQQSSDRADGYRSVRLRYPN